MRGLRASVPGSRADGARTLLAPAELSWSLAEWAESLLPGLSACPTALSLCLSV